MFICEKSRLKNLNQEIYKRFIKPIYIPLLTLYVVFYLLFQKYKIILQLKQ